MTITIESARDSRAGGDPAPGRLALEQAFGDPFDEHNPTGFAELLAADERQELPAVGEAGPDGPRPAPPVRPGGPGGPVPPPGPPPPVLGAGLRAARRPRPRPVTPAAHPT